MTTMTYGRMSPSGFNSLKTRMLRWVHAIRDRIQEERRVRDNIIELSALNDRSLADIGVSRSDIETFARHGR